jgi:poly-gamma-glutamate synthesis protein (capsule biosynthesis protein)
VRPLEVYHDRLILYGCGDFIDDYEGISGYEQYRDDLVLMFFPTLSPRTGALLAMEMTPLQIRHMRLNRPSAADTRWVCDKVNEISRAFGTQVVPTAHGALRWSQK